MERSAGDGSMDRLHPLVPLNGADQTAFHFRRRHFLRHGGCRMATLDCTGPQPNSALMALGLVKYTVKPTPAMIIIHEPTILMWPVACRRKLIIT